MHCGDRGRRSQWAALSAQTALVAVCVVATARVHSPHVRTPTRAIPNPDARDAWCRAAHARLYAGVVVPTSQRPREPCCQRAMLPREPYCHATPIRALGTRLRLRATIHDVRARTSLRQGAHAALTAAHMIWRCSLSLSLPLSRTHAYVSPLVPPDLWGRRPCRAWPAELAPAELALAQPAAHPFRAPFAAHPSAGRKSSP